MTTVMIVLMLVVVMTVVMMLAGTLLNSSVFRLRIQLRTPRAMLSLRIAIRFILRLGCARLRSHNAYSSVLRIPNSKCAYCTFSI